jgi:hypothetical protein
MDWTAAIDIYCERTSAGFWAEPVNAWSNLGFPVAATLAAIAAWRRGGATSGYWTLVVLGALVGVGSFLFHTFANVWAEYADTIPIWTFVAATVAVAAKRITGLRLRPGFIIGLTAAVLFTVLFITATDPDPAAAPRPDPLNGSGQYAPAFVALGVLAGFAWVQRMPIRGPLLAATLAFLAALVFRSIDMEICTTVPLGTHFLWHLLDALVVGLILRAMLMTDPHRRSNP